MLRRKVIPEYIQDEANAENLSKKALEILLETKKRSAYSGLREIMGQSQTIKRVAKKKFFRNWGHNETEK